VLLSTRISGLLSSSVCTEVALSLMTTQEAIELLAHGPGLDSEVISPTVVEVAKLCGRKYLMLCCVA
jgi:hypothetical protein